MPRSTPDQTDTSEPVLASVPDGLFIDGRWQQAGSGRRLEVEDPATGSCIATVADAGPEDAVAALDAAAGAQREWAASAPRDRAEILRAAFEIILRRSEEFARLITLEVGKPLTDSRAEVAYGAEFFRWFSEEAVRIAGRYATTPERQSRILVLRRPVGPSLLVTPWNFPLAMATRKLGPALAAGCTAVVKPAQLTPLTTSLLMEVLREAGLPPGVVNVIPSSQAAEVVSTLIRDPRLRKLSFTGSTQVGRALLRDAADNVLRCSMELGGNAPFILFADADLSAAVDGAMVAKFRNVGAACTAANRFLVHEDVAEEFAARIVERVSALRMGPGLDEGVDISALVGRGARERVAGLVDDAVAHGGRLLVGGTVPEGPGWFYPATVITGAGPEARIHTEEIFGPVLSIVTFRDEREVLATANRSEYGLMAYLYTTNVNRALRMAEELDTGMLGLNTGIVSNPAAPFGGVKHSGLGREGGVEGIDEYLETTYVGVDVAGI